MKKRRNERCEEGRQWCTGHTSWYGYGAYHWPDSSILPRYGTRAYGRRMTSSPTDDDRWNIFSWPFGDLECPLVRTTTPVNYNDYGLKHPSQPLRDCGHGKVSIALSAVLSPPTTKEVFMSDTDKSTAMVSDSPLPIYLLIPLGLCPGFSRTARPSRCMMRNSPTRTGGAPFLRTR